MRVVPANRRDVHKYAAINYTPCDVPAGSPFEVTALPNIVPCYIENNRKKEEQLIPKYYSQTKRLIVSFMPDNVKNTHEQVGR